MTILFVLEHFYPYTGGAEKLFEYLTTGLVKKGHEVKVITTRYDKTLLKKETIRGVEIIRVQSMNRYLFTLLSLPKILKYGTGCDLIHTTSYNAALPVALANIWLRKKTVITFHEVWGKLWFRLPFITLIGKTGHYLFEQLIIRLPFTKFVGVSEFTSGELRKYKKQDRVNTIYNGLDYSELENFEHHEPDEFVYTYYGRLGASKGIDLLLKAAHTIKDKIPGSRLKMIIPKIPSGLYRKVIHRIRQLELADHITLLHNLERNELYEQVSASSCVVIPSYSEGFGFTAAESSAMRVPIVCSGKGALSDVVSGRVVRMEEQTAEALCSAILKAYRSEWEQGDIRTFPLQQMMAGYETLYNSLK